MIIAVVKICTVLVRDHNTHADKHVVVMFSLARFQVGQCYPVDQVIRLSSVQAHARYAKRLQITILKLSHKQFHVRILFKYSDNRYM